MIQTTYLLELSSQPDFPRNLEEVIIDYYKNDLNGRDTYVRYYPDTPIEGLNEWLSNNGMQVNSSDKYFYSY